VDSQGKMVSKIAHSDAKSYTYEKGYCTGHPAPEIEYEEVVYDAPSVILGRIKDLEQQIQKGILALEEILNE